MERPFLMVGSLMAGFQKPGGTFEVYTGNITGLHRDLATYEKALRQISQETAAIAA